MGDKIRLAVLGSNGQLGTDLIRECRSGAQYHAIGIPHSELDVGELAEVRNALMQIKPGVVINCAAHVNVDECEERPEEAFRVNSLGALHVARASTELNALCVQISTDFVFAGEKSSPYVEDDVPCPINVYGASKLTGEYLLRATAPKHLILRVASLFGIAGSRGKGGNFIETIIRRVKTGERISVIDDIYMSPTYTRDLAAKVLELIQAKAPSGVYHLTNKGYCSWYQLAATVCELAGLKADLMRASVRTYPQKARRPVFSALASQKIGALGLEVMRPWEMAVEAYLKEKGHILPCLT
jgi:dTDP-4-dehydrorhamnose reductase